MKITSEINLQDFEFWCGAEDTANYLTADEFRDIEFALEDMYPDGIDETSLNDIFWLDEDFVAELIGYESFEDIINERGN